MLEIYIRRATDNKHKYEAIIGDRIVKFGNILYSDYTLHHDDDRKRRYILRHQSTGAEDWTINVLLTAGFYSRWILWNQKSLEESIADLNRKYTNIRFRLLI
jgi:hypothetical protein